jgi:hypothetical protein
VVINGLDGSDTQKTSPSPLRGEGWGGGDKDRQWARSYIFNRLNEINPIFGVNAHERALTKKHESRI